MVLKLRGVIRSIDENIEIVLMTAYTDKSLSEIVREMDLLQQAALYQKAICS